MLSFNIETLSDAERLVQFCQDFSGEIDIVCGRYTVDAKSFLGVAALVGRVVGVDPHGLKTQETIKKFTDGISKL